MRFLWLILVPIILDLLKFGDILRRPKGFAFKLAVPSVIPSLTQILADPPAQQGGFTINFPFAGLGGAFILLALLLLLLGAFLKGGFLGCVLAGINEQEVAVDTFISYSKKFFGRFIAQILIIFFFTMVIGLTFLALGPLALLLLIGYMILSLLLIFWDYIVVAEDVALIEAAKMSWDLVRQNMGKVFGFVLPIMAITALFGVLANVITASVILAILAIVAYGYYGTAVVFAMMSFYMESRQSST